MDDSATEAAAKIVGAIKDLQRRVGVLEARLSSPSPTPVAKPLTTLRVNDKGFARQLECALDASPINEVLVKRLTDFTVELRPAYPFGESAAAGSIDHLAPELQREKHDGRIWLADDDLDYLVNLLTEEVKALNDAEAVGMEKVEALRKHLADEQDRRITNPDRSIDEVVGEDGITTKSPRSSSCRNATILGPTGQDNGKNAAPKSRHRAGSEQGCQPVALVCGGKSRRPVAR